MPTPPTTPVRIPLPGGGAIGGALALPDGPGPHPGVIVLHEMFGLNDDIRRITARFASEGYVACAPDLYSFGSNKAVCLTRVVMDMQRGASSRTIAHIHAARAFLSERSEVDASRLAVIGFCMGGGFSLVYGTTGAVRAASVNYGAVPKERKELDSVCPVVASYGALDRLFRAQGERLEDHLEALGIPHDVKIYPESGHSFLSYDNGPNWVMRLPSPMHVGYNETDAEDAWKRILGFFAEHVG